jgi:hypothetical protein
VGKTHVADTGFANSVHYFGVDCLFAVGCGGKKGMKKKLMEK